MFFDPIPTISWHVNQRRAVDRFFSQPAQQTPSHPCQRSRLSATHPWRKGVLREEWQSCGCQYRVAIWDQAPCIFGWCWTRPTSWQQESTKQAPIVLFTCSDIILPAWPADQEDENWASSFYPSLHVDKIFQSTPARTHGSPWTYCGTHSRKEVLSCKWTGDAECSLAEWPWLPVTSQRLLQGDSGDIWSRPTHEIL